MKNSLLFSFNADKPNKKIKVQRAFAAPLNIVWDAWTKSEILDQWWAPKPWKAKTKSMDFKEGGRWIYAMVGPDGEMHWSLAEFLSIKPQVSYSGLDGFCDENGNLNKALPRSKWDVQFEQQNDTTLVHIAITYDELKDLETIIEMGFKEGFTAGLENLDLYLEQQFKLRKENKTSNSPRVSFYLNFPGKTEEAFNFYKKVFNGTFGGGGFVRFGDSELPSEHPPMNDADKKLILHAELTIMGGYVLMATDAPESMGFKMEHGNNMHINLEPDSRAETERIFNELSAGGEVSMPLADMFWGAYFGSFKDRYGINWMLNFQKV